VGQNTPLHLAVLNENFKAIEYLCRFPNINLYERNAMGQTPRDIALLLPRKKVALKIIDFINKKINQQRSTDSHSLAPGSFMQRPGASPLLRKSTFKSSRVGLNGVQTSSHKPNFSIVPHATNLIAQSPQTKAQPKPNAFNFEVYQRQLSESMNNVIVGMERSNSVMGKRSTTSVDSSENDDLLEDESSHGSNLVLLKSQNSLAIEEVKTPANNAAKNHQWEPKKAERLAQIYDSFIEHGGVLGAFSTQIFDRFRQ